MITSEMSSPPEPCWVTKCFHLLVCLFVYLMWYKRITGHPRQHVYTPLHIRSHTGDSKSATEQ